MRDLAAYGHPVIASTYVLVRFRRLTARAPQSHPIWRQCQQSPREQNAPIPKIETGASSEKEEYLTRAEKIPDRYGDQIAQTRGLQYTQKEFEQAHTTKKADWLKGAFFALFDAKRSNKEKDKLAKAVLEVLNSVHEPSLQNEALLYDKSRPIGKQTHIPSEVRASLPRKYKHLDTAFTTAYHFAKQKGKEVTVKQKWPLDKAA